MQLPEPFLDAAASVVAHGGAGAPRVAVVAPPRRRHPVGDGGIPAAADAAVAQFNRKILA